MHFVQNFPFFSILLALVCAVITLVLSRENARRLTLGLIAGELVLTLGTLIHCLRENSSYAYWMGHFPAPWGNEIRAGVFELVPLTVFLCVILLSFLGGWNQSEEILERGKSNLICVIWDLCMLSLIALVYTNDLFTAYVFIEINTLAATGIVTMKQDGFSLVGGVRYMIMNLLGSSLFLLGIVILYAVTGHLLMVPLHEKISQLVAEGTYRVPLLMVMSIMSVGVAMKSALFPFEKWLPGAYTSTTSSGAAMLSSIVSKGYIFLLIKLYVRVFGLEAVESLGVCDVLFIFGAAGMVMGSISAIRVRTTRMMLAYSSVAQIGYIYFALGMGSEIGVVCAVWHAMTHSLTKSMLFISTEELEKSCGNDRSKAALRGGFYRSPVAAVAFMLGAANLVGVPLLGTFVTKILMAGAAIQVGGRHAMIALALIAVSTILNLVYLMNAAISLFIPGEDRELRPANAVTTGSLICWIALNLGLGLMSSGIIGMLWNGLRVFA